MRARIPNSKAEKRSIEKEIKRQLAEYDQKHEVEIDAAILWVLHEQFGFGVKRLKKFYDVFGKEINALVKRYEMDDSDKIWLCTYKLKEYGIDLEKWRAEKLAERSMSITD